MNIGKTPEQVRPHFENMVLFIAALLELKPEIGLREIELQPFFQLAGSFSTCTASPPPAAHRRVKVLIHEAGNAGSTESPFFVPYLHLLAAKASSEDGSRWVFARLDSEKSGSSIINRKQFLREIEEHIQRYEPDAYTQQGFGNVYGFGGTKPRYRQPRCSLVPLLFRTHEPPWQCKYAKGAAAPARGGAWSRAEASGCHLVAALAYSGEPARLAIGASSMSSHSLLACLLVFSPLMYQSCCGLVTGLFDLALPLVSVSRSADAQVAGMLAITPFSTIPHSRIADLDYLDGICSISTTGSC